MPTVSSPYIWKYKPPFGTQIDYSIPITRGLYAAWVLNENTGSGFIVDSGPYDHQSTLRPNPPSWKSGKTGPSLYFDPNTAQEIRVTPAAGKGYFTNVQNACSIFSVVNVVPSGTDSGAGCIWQAGMITDSTDALYLGLDGSTTLNWYTIAKAGVISFGWHTFGVSQVKANSRWFLVDGTITANTTNLTSSAIGALQAMVLGQGYVNSATGGLGAWAGNIECVYIWNRALSSGELIALNTNPYLFFKPPTSHQSFFISSLNPPASSTPTNFTIYPSGWLAENFGAATITTSGVTVYPSGFTTENFGVQQIIAGQVFIRPSGFSGTSFGVDTFNPGGFTFRPSGFLTENFGVDTILPGIVYVRPSGFATESLGISKFTYYINENGFGGPLFGTSTFSPGNVIFSPTTFSPVRFGVDTFTPGIVTIRPSGFGQTLFGTDYIIGSLPGIIIPIGFGGSVFGVDTITSGPVQIKPSGFVGVIFGVDQFSPGGVNCRPSGIPAGGFGIDTITRGSVFFIPSGISPGGFGTDQITTGLVNVRPSGFSTENFGIDRFVPGQVTFYPSGVISALSFGTHTLFYLPTNIFPNSFNNFQAGTAIINPGSVGIIVLGAGGESFGSHHVFNVFTGSLRIIHEVKYLSKTHAADAVIDLGRN